MHPPYVVIHKERGETPLMVLERWREENHFSLPATYAGRLDPMASGKLLILLNEECKQREKYTGLDKEYEVEVLLDVATDTGDVLGMPTYSNKETHPTDVTGALKTLLGTHTLPYPSFSSKTVNGKPLFLYALEGTLDTITIPTHEETIYKISLLERKDISAEELKAMVAQILENVPRSDEPSKVFGADFRQDAIRGAWDLLPLPRRSFTILKLRVTCGTGTYMRTLASRLGEALGTQALALSITRTRIGTYQRLLGWTKEY